MRLKHHFDKTGSVETFWIVPTFGWPETAKVSTQLYLPGDLCVSLSIGCGVIWARCTMAPRAIQ
jgi:hypothetical protein